MTPEELDRVLQKIARFRPFRSFTLEFNNGRTLLVTHPEAVVRWGSLHVYFAPDRGWRLFSAAAAKAVVLAGSTVG